MTKLLQRVDVTLRSFYIFNSKLGKTDGEEHKKIVYYHPDDIEMNTKIKDVGLSEAIIAFTSNFTESTNDCKSLHTQKTTQVFYQPEPDYWMVVVLNVPKELRCKDGIEVAEYCGGEVHERMYRAILEQCYHMFRLFHGTFRMNLQDCLESCKNGEQTPSYAATIAIEDARLIFQKKLTKFYDKLISTMKFPACNLMDVTKSVQYLALKQHIFLSAHNFVNTTLATFATIADVVLLYKEHIVCGGKFSSVDLYYLHKFIVDEELLAKLPVGGEVTGEGAHASVLSRSDSTIAECYRNGAFITNLIKSNDEKEDVSAALHDTALPKLYLGKGAESTQAYYMIIYRLLNIVCCLFINADQPAPKSQEFYDEIQTYMAPKLSSLCRDIIESLTTKKQLPNANKSASNLTSNTKHTLATSCVQAETDASTSKYLFIDELSFKHMTNIIYDRKRPQLLMSTSMPTSVLQLIIDLDEQDEAEGNSAAMTSPPYKESLIKATNDFWIFKRSRNWRKYYVIIFNIKSTLLDVTAEAMRIVEQESADEVFFDK